MTTKSKDILWRLVLHLQMFRNLMKENEKFGIIL